MATIDDFKKLDLRMATVREVKEHPNADRLYVLTLDVAGEIREVVAGIRAAYQPDDIRGKQVVVVFNLDPVTLRGVESQGMVLAAKDEEGRLALLTSDRTLKPGARVS